ncbi:uncharacterized protein LOC126839536 [Adelges cooleyi]|uniref:uncharacterized protein LOC126839536 n=1 Tax=Adelges cooleyi TaxID=133065 RepID=UPI00217FE06B|nr:uncharacterized protein LOC126839536 [Adelges cooleyi]
MYKYDFTVLREYCDRWRSKDLIRTHSSKRYAIVTLVMLDNRYVDGALVLAESIQRYNAANIDRVCMIDRSVSDANRRRLEERFTRVVNVPYIVKQLSDRYLRSRRQRELYGRWIDYSYTKWNCLDEALFGRYDKVLFVDADVVFTSRYHADASLVYAVFDVPTPAAVIWNPYNRKQYSPYALKTVLEAHGNKCPSAVLAQLSRQAFSGGFTLLKPDDAVLRLVKSTRPPADVPMNGPDETLLYHIYTAVLRVDIYNLNAICNYKPDGCNTVQQKHNILSVHYYGTDKPFFGQSVSGWHDTCLWAEIYEQINK